MSKRTTFKLLILAAICFTATLLAGCVGEVKVNDFLHNNNALHQQVTYYGNGGYFDNTNNLKVKNIYYHVNDFVLTDFDKVAGKSISRDNYVFAGWYYAELTNKVDEENKPELDEQGNPVMVPVFEDEENLVVKSTTRRLEDDLKIQENTHLYVCAHWEKDIELRYVLAGDSPVTIEDGGETRVVNPGERLTGKEFLRGSATVGTTAPVKSTDSTFLQCYSDPECTIPAPQSMTKPTGENAQERATVYAKYISGIWEVVKTKNDVRRMFVNLYTSNKYYIFDDIDCAGEPFIPKAQTSNTNCYIEGNGKTLSNIKFEYPQGSGIEAGDTCSIFGTFGATAAFKNLTLENLTVVYTTRVTVAGLYFFCAGDNGATFENFNIRNAVMEVDYQGTLMNIQQIGGVYQTDHWLFGNVATDADYTKVAEGQLKIDGKKLSMKGEVILDEPASAAAQN